MNNELYHYGVLGMKWGRRKKRFRQFIGMNKKSDKNRVRESDWHEDYKKVHDGKRLSQLSDSELKKRLNRLRLEQEYTRLTTSEVKKGKNVLTKLFETNKEIANATTATIKNYNNVMQLAKIINGG